MSSANKAWKYALLPAPVRCTLTTETESRSHAFKGRPALVYFKHMMHAIFFHGPPTTHRPPSYYAMHARYNGPAVRVRLSQCLSCLRNFGSFPCERHPIKCRNGDPTLCIMPFRDLRLSVSDLPRPYCTPSSFRFRPSRSSRTR